jgi:hypothetical protein
MVLLLDVVYMMFHLPEEPHLAIWLRAQMHEHKSINVTSRAAPLSLPCALSLKEVLERTWAP